MDVFKIIFQDLAIRQIIVVQDLICPVSSQVVDRQVVVVAEVEEVRKI
jgi:hypothetical protein